MTFINCNRDSQIYIQICNSFKHLGKSPSFLVKDKGFTQHSPKDDTFKYIQINLWLEGTKKSCANDCWLLYRSHYPETMRFCKQSWRQLSLKLTFALGSLWMLFLVLQTQSPLSTDLIHSNNWLEYRDYDFGPERVCNCSAIQEGDKEELLEAKLLTITKEFQKNIQIPDEYYINETKDCRCVALNYGASQNYS